MNEEIINTIHTTLHQIQEDMKSINDRIIWCEENIKANMVNKE